MFTARELEDMFSGTPETSDPAIADLYYDFQRKYIRLAYSITRKVPDYPTNYRAIMALKSSFEDVCEAIFRKMELNE